MALQAGFGLSRLIFVIGAGLGGTILISNGKMSDLFDSLQAFVKHIEKSPDSANADSDPLAAQIHRLAQEIRQITTSRPITVLNAGSTQTDLTSLIIPAATLSAMGYGYMWWKGLSFSDLMFVTKANMDAAVTNLTTQLECLTEFLARAKKHLAQQIDTLDDKIGEQNEISKLIQKEVHDTHENINKVSSQVSSVQWRISVLEDKLDSLDHKQNLLLHGVRYLVDKSKCVTTESPVPQLQEQPKISGRSRGLLPGSIVLGLQCLVESLDKDSREESESIEDGDFEFSKQPTSHLPRGVAISAIDI